MEPLPGNVVQRPSVGRIVHVIGERGEIDAAIVTGLSDPDDPMCVSLTVFTVNGLFLKYRVYYDGSQRIPCTWSWPDRV